MDILTHTLSGLAVGTVAAGFSKKGPRSGGTIDKNVAYLADKSLPNA